MNSPIERNEAQHSRSTPGWVRLTIWVAIPLLTLSVIAGMFLY
ncbi:MAG: hypothetical protein BMS9Abin12_0863 [Acidimicrobiia bacterium]|nr:MAG: hypothetical protein BMS9Abin12_0863 [Acidimicrobiia bacterium]